MKLLYILGISMGFSLYAFGGLVGQVIQIDPKALEGVGVTGIAVLLIMDRMLHLKQPSNADILNVAHDTRKLFDGVDARIATLVREAEDIARRVERLEKQPPPG